MMEERGKEQAPLELDIGRARKKASSLPVGNADEISDLQTSIATTSSTSSQRRGILRFRCREYMIPSERKALKRSQKAKKMKDDENKVEEEQEDKQEEGFRFCDVYKVGFIPGEKYFKRHEAKKFVLHTGYLLLGHKVKDAVSKLRLLDTPYFMEEKPALEFWCARLRDGEILECNGNQNGYLSFRNVVRNYPNGVVSLPKRMSLTEITVMRGINVDNRTAYEELLANRSKTHKQRKIEKRRLDMGALKSRVRNICRVLGFSRNFRRNEWLKTERSRVEKICTLKRVLGLPALADNSLIKIMARAMTINDYITTVHSKAISSLVVALSGIELLSSETPKRDYLAALDQLQIAHRIFLEITALIDGVDTSLEKNSVQNREFKRFGMTQSLRKFLFGKILVASSRGYYLCLVTESLFTRKIVNGVEVYTLQKPVNLSQDEVAEIPNEMKEITSPPVLTAEFQDLPLMFRSLSSYWYTKKVQWVATFVQRMNNGMVCAIINNNRRLVEYFEKFKYPGIMKNTSNSITEYPTKFLKHDTASVKQYLKVFKKRKNGRNPNRRKSLNISELSLMLNAVVRAELSHSKCTGHSTGDWSAGHGGKLLRTVILMGHVDMARYLVSRGLSIKNSIASRQTKYIMWLLPSEVKKLRRNGSGNVKQSVKKTKARNRPEKARADVSEVSVPKKLKANDSERRVPRNNVNRPTPRSYEYIFDGTGYHKESTRQLSIMYVRNLPSFAVEGLLNLVFLRKQALDKNTANSLISEANGRFVLAMDILKSKKVKVKSNDSSLLRALVPALVILFKGGKSFKEYGVRNGFRSLIEAASKEYKTSLKGTDFGNRARRFIALKALELVNSILSKALKEFRKPNLISATLIEECIQRDQFETIPFISTNPAVIQNALKILFIRMKEPLASYKQILKGFFVLHNMFSINLDDKLLSAFFSERYLSMILDSNVWVNPGDLPFIKKVFSIAQVRRHVGTIHEDELLSLYGGLRVVGFQAEWVLEMLSDRGVPAGLIDRTVAYFALIKKKVQLDRSQLLSFREGTLSSLFSRILRNEFNRDSLVPVLQILEVHPGVLCDVDSHAFINLFINLMSKEVFPTESQNMLVDLTAFKLYRLLTKLFFMEDVCENDNALLKLFFIILETLFDISDRCNLSYDVIYDFILTVSTKLDFNLNEVHNQREKERLEEEQRRKDKASDPEKSQEQIQEEVHSMELAEVNSKQQDESNTTEQEDAMPEQRQDSREAELVGNVYDMLALCCLYGRVSYEWNLESHAMKTLRLKSPRTLEGALQEIAKGREGV